MKDSDICVVICTPGFELDTLEYDGSDFVYWVLEAEVDIFDTGVLYCGRQRVTGELLY